MISYVFVPLKLKNSENTLSFILIQSDDYDSLDKPFFATINCNATNSISVFILLEKTCRVRTKMRWKDFDDKFQGRWISLYESSLSSRPILVYPCQGSGYSFVRASSLSRKYRRIFQLVITRLPPAPSNVMNEEKKKRYKKAMSTFGKYTWWRRSDRRALYVTIGCWIAPGELVSVFYRRSVRETLTCLFCGVRTDHTDCRNAENEKSDSPRIRRAYFCSSSIIVNCVHRSLVLFMVLFMVWLF